MGSNKEHPGFFLKYISFLHLFICSQAELIVQVKIILTIYRLVHDNYYADWAPKQRRHGRMLLEHMQMWQSWLLLDIDLLVFSQTQPISEVKDYAL
jgi:hypothetical protein